MAFKLPNGDILRNLQEQVQKNKEDIQRHYEIERVIADWGIRIIGRMDEWETPPTQSYEYGDAFAVGPDGGPFVFYIYTRGNPDYWFDYGAISIVGPQGPAGEGLPGPRGARGSKWYIGNNQPTGTEIREGDMWLQSSTGNIYIFTISGTQNWLYAGNIIGPQGIPGPEGKTGPQGPSGPVGPRGERGYTTITNIIGKLPEGSIISDTYDPAEQSDNATVLMPVNGETHAFVIIDGQWTDAGPYSGGSSIYANGEYQQTFDADTKLDKVNNPSQGNSLYGVLEGQQKMIKLDYANYATAQAIPLRGTPNGAIFIRDDSLTGSGNIPIGQRAVNKNYVDNAIAKAHAEKKHAVLYWENRNTPITFTVDLGILIDPNNPTIDPSRSIVLTGTTGYTLQSGGAWFNGVGINTLTLNQGNTLELQTWFINSTQPSQIQTFTINSTSFEGTVATFNLTPTNEGMESGMFVFEALPSIPS